MAQQGTIIGTLPTEAIQTNFGQIVAQGTANFNAARERERKQLSEVRAAAGEAYGSDKLPFDIKVAQDRNLNDVANETVSLFREENSKALAEYMRLPSYNNPARKKLENLRNFAKDFSNLHNAMVTSETQMVEGLQKGTVSEMVTLDPDGNFNLTQRLKDGTAAPYHDSETGKPMLRIYNKDGKFVEDISYEEAQAKIMQLPTNVNTAAWLDDTLKLIAVKREEKPDGTYVNQAVEWGDEQRAQAMRMIDMQIGDDTMPHLLYEATKNEEGGPVFKYKGFTPADKALVQNHLLSLVEGGFDEMSGISGSDPNLRLNIDAADKRREEMKKIYETPSGALITPMSESGKPLVRAGYYLFAVTPTQLEGIDKDITVTSIGSTREGKLALYGTRRIKINDFPPGTKGEEMKKKVQEEVDAKNAQLKERLGEDYDRTKDFVSLLEPETDEDGKVTYYVNEPWSLKYSGNPTHDQSNVRPLMNQFSTLLEVGSEDELRGFNATRMAYRWGEQYFRSTFGDEAFEGLKKNPWGITFQGGGASRFNDR